MDASTPWQFFRPQSAVEISNTFDPNIAIEKSNALSDMAQRRQATQLQIQDALQARDDKAAAKQAIADLSQTLSVQDAMAIKSGQMTFKDVAERNRKEKAAAEYQAAIAPVQLERPLKDNVTGQGISKADADFFIAHPEAFPEGDRAGMREALIQQGYIAPVSQKTPEERDIALAQYAVADPAGSAGLVKLREWQGGREDKLNAAQMSIEAKREMQQHQIDADMRMAQLTAALKGSVSDAPPKVKPGERAFKDELGNWKVEIIPGASTWQTTKSKEADDRSFVQNIVPMFDKNIKDIEKLVKNPAMDNLFGRIGGVESLDFMDGTRAARADLAQVIGAMETSGFNMMRSTSGSAGAMTEKEWNKMQTYFNIVRNATTPEQAKAALIEAAGSYRRMQNIAKEKYQEEWGNGQFGDKTLSSRIGGNLPASFGGYSRPASFSDQQWSDYINRKGVNNEP